MLVEAGRLTRCCVLLRGGYGGWMIQPDDPERALALVYAPQDRREALAVLFRLDERMGQVLAAAHEPMKMEAAQFEQLIQGEYRQWGAIIPKIPKRAN